VQGKKINPKTFFKRKKKKKTEEKTGWEQTQGEKRIGVFSLGHLGPKFPAVGGVKERTQRVGSGVQKNGG